MSQKNTSSTLNLKNTSLGKLLVGASKSSITGYITIKQHEPNDYKLIIWFEKGDIIAVSGITPLIEKLEIYQIVSPRVIPTLRQEKLVEPIGKKLLKVYEVEETEIAKLFEAQIAEIENIIGDTTGEVKIVRLKDTKSFPWHEITGRRISGHQVAKTAIEKNFAQRYWDKVPERERTIETGPCELDKVQLERHYLDIIRFCNSNLTLAQISKKIDVQLKQVQRRVYILKLLEIVKISITKDAAQELWKKFNPQADRNRRKENNFSQEKNWQKPAISILIANLIIILLTWSGVFQLTELSILDRWIRLRGTKPNKDITLVLLDDRGIAQFPSYPIADRYLAQVLRNISKYDPAVIGLDIYRDLPVVPGHEELLEVYENTPELIGVEKIADSDRVNPPPILGEADRVGFSDLVLDQDQILRRGVWMVEADKFKFNLGALTALYKLQQSGISIEQNERDPFKYTIGETKFSNLKPNSGGYWQKELIGLQTIINFRYNTKDFTTIRFENVYKGKFDPQEIEDKIVLIGVNADSLKDFVFTPISRTKSGARPMPGVVAHANIAANFLDTAKGKPPIQVESQQFEVGWIIFWSLVGIGSGVVALELNLKNKQNYGATIAIQVVVLTLAVFGTSSSTFLLSSIWIPVIPALVNALASSMIVNTQYQKELESLFYADRATKVANRHYFDRIFENYLEEAQERDGNLGVMLCQVTEWEKIESELDSKTAAEYLKAIAQQITYQLKDENPDNTVARFTSDTFVFLIPNTNEIKMEEISQKIQTGMKKNKVLIRTGIPNLEFGIALSDPKLNNTFALIAEADEKLTKS